MTTLASRLNAYFAAAATIDAVGRRREPSTAEVAQAICDDPTHDVTVSRSYLAALRSGAQTNPTVGVLNAIVRYFRPRVSTEVVSLANLTGDDMVDSDPDWQAALADREVRSIAMRAGELNPQMRRQLLAMMDALDSDRGGRQSEQ